MEEYRIQVGVDLHRPFEFGHHRVHRQMAELAVFGIVQDELGVPTIGTSEWATDRPDRVVTKVVERQVFAPPDRRESAFRREEPLFATRVLERRLCGHLFAGHQW